MGIEADRWRTMMGVDELTDGIADVTKLGAGVEPMCPGSTRHVDNRQ
jgi:hypothetical protein